MEKEDQKELKKQYPCFLYQLHSVTSIEKVIKETRGGYLKNTGPLYR